MKPTGSILTDETIYMMPLFRHVKLIESLQDIFYIKASARSWHMPLLACISLGLPLVIGMALNHFESGLFACMGGIVILYLNPNSNFIERMLTMLVCSFGFIVSFAIGLVSSIHPIIAVLSFGIYAFSVHWLSLFLKMAAPRSFFFIMLAAMSVCMPFEPFDIAPKLGLISLGVLGATLICFIYSCILFTYQQSPVQPSLHISIAVKRYDIIVTAFIIGLCMMTSLGIGYLFKLENPYWIPISCLAVMQGNNTRHIFIRVVSRIFGTFLGVGLIWVLLFFVQTPISITITLILLQFAIEFLITKNYTYSVIFITAFTFLLAEASNPMLHSPTDLFKIRMLDIVIGSIIGGIGGWLLYHEQLNRKVMQGIQKMK